MRIVIKTANNNPIPEIIFSGTNDEFKKDMFMKINQYAYYGYKVSWQTEGLTLTRGDDIIYMRIINHIRRIENNTELRSQPQILA